MVKNFQKSPGLLRVFAQFSIWKRFWFHTRSKNRNEGSPRLTVHRKKCPQPPPYFYKKIFQNIRFPFSLEQVRNSLLKSNHLNFLFYFLDLCISSFALDGSRHTWIHLLVVGILPLSKNKCCISTAQVNMIGGTPYYIVYSVIGHVIKNWIANVGTWGVPLSIHFFITWFISE